MQLFGSHMSAQYTRERTRQTVHSTRPVGQGLGSPPSRGPTLSHAALRYVRIVGTEGDAHLLDGKVGDVLNVVLIRRGFLYAACSVVEIDT